mmetsp:Transcript_59543/g.118307  ORF Transcript_59543/g.118307 Transcript_59543/m.118307 type:complete len:89 (-) Transcript_59543:484-750(-)
MPAATAAAAATCVAAGTTAASPAAATATAPDGGGGCAAAVLWAADALWTLRVLEVKCAEDCEGAQHGKACPPEERQPLRAPPRVTRLS